MNRRQPASPTRARANPRVRCLEEAALSLHFTGIQDPLRPDVPLAVKTCQKAGIFVRMVTGDNVVTAKAIARSCGIFDEARGDVALTGPEFRKMTPSQLDKVRLRTAFARGQPRGTMAGCER